MISVIKKAARNVKSVCVLGFSVVLTACGGSGQDKGSVSSFSQSYSGLAIDGYLARATVFLDTNNDGTRNAWEPFAFTDNEGYYSFNPNTDTDYCATQATAQQAQYCLITSSSFSSVVVRVDGGYDVMTGEPFVGQLSRRVDNTDPENSQHTLISPITSLLTNISDQRDQSSLLSSIGLDEGDIDVNYLNVDGSGAIDTQILNSALKVHKTVAVLADRLTDTYDEIGEQVGTPNDASASVYNHLADQLLSSGHSFDTFVADGNSIASVLDLAEQNLREVYERKEFILPADMGSISSRESFARVINVVPNIASVVNSLIDVNRVDITIEEVKGQSRALESLVIKTINEVEDDTSIENAADFFTRSENAALVRALVNTLSSDGADVVSLAANNFNGPEFASVDTLERVFQAAQDIQAFTQVGGRQIRVSDLDLGQGPDKLDDSEVEWYFLGESTDLEGAFVACVKHIDDANIDGSLGEGNTRGELVDGYWSLLGATSQRQQSYSLLLTLTFLGTTYQAIMKPSGGETIGLSEYQRVRFDNDGEINIWHSGQGFETLGELPANNADCQQRLPSRLGI